jgi:hypothetical protein
MTQYFEITVLRKSFELFLPLNPQNHNRCTLLYSMCTLYSVQCTLLQELTEYFISHIGWRRTKQSGGWEISSTFSRDIFYFFQLFRWKFSTGSKFSDFIPFTQDGNLRSFEVFRLIPFTQDGNFRPVRSFPIIFPLHRMEILDVSKFSDCISIAKDGNRRLFEDFRLHSLFKGWKYPMIRSFLLIFPIKGRKSLNFTAKKITSNKSFEQFYYAHRY